jgi:DNA polymerase III subunit epsilon
MTGGQVTFALSAEADRVSAGASAARAARPLASRTILVIPADEDELAAHEHVLVILDKISGGNTVWRKQ